MKRIEQPAQLNGTSVRLVDFKVVHFFDKEARRAGGQTGAEVILLYGLGEDGVIREFANGKWTAFPVT